MAVGDSEMILSAISIFSDPPETETCSVESSEPHETLMRQKTPRNGIKYFINIICQYCNTDNTERQNEYDTCVLQNFNNEHVQKIYFLNEEKTIK